MALDCFMWVVGGHPGVSGETADKTYQSKKAFEIYSFSFGASNPMSIGSFSGGLGAGKVSISSFSIMKKTDSASPTLFTNCCMGTHFPEAHVVLRKSGGGIEAIEYLKYDFTEVFVESIQWSGSGGGDETPTESVSFGFGKIAMEYTPQKSKGEKGTPIPATWDLQTNTP